LYGLKIAEQWQMLRGAPPHADWEVYPASPWNYALAIDVGAPEQSIRFETGPVTEQPFSPTHAPVSARVKGRRVAGWDLEQNAAAPVPPSPLSSEEPLEELTLLPYGSMNLRIAEFPILAR